MKPKEQKFMRICCIIFYGFTLTVTLVLNQTGWWFGTWWGVMVPLRTGKVLGVFW